MRRIAFIGMLLIFAAQSHATDVFEVKIVKKISLNKKDIFKGVSLWMVESFKSPRNVIELKDPEIGVIIGNGGVGVKDVWVGGFLTDMTTFKFKMKVDVKDNKYRMTFSNVYAVTKWGESPIEETNPQLNEKLMTEEFGKVASSLYSYLEKYAKDSDW